MRKRLLGLLFIVGVVGAVAALSSCGGVYKVEGEVEVKHQIDFGSMYQFFVDYCGSDLQCTNEKFDAFIEWLTKLN